MTSGGAGIRWWPGSGNSVRFPLSRDGRFANRPYDDGLRPVFACRSGREHSPAGDRPSGLLPLQE